MKLADYMYYQDDWATIYCGDCLEIMPLMNEKVDLTLTDFPYGNDTEYDMYEDSRKNLVDLVKTSMPLILKLSKVTLIACGIGNVSLFPPPDWILCWYWKHTQSGSSRWGFNNWQPILAYGEDPYLAAGMGRKQDAMTFPSISIRDQNINHPCPKPFEVWRWFLNRGSASKTDLVFDPFLGSGTTCIAAKYLSKRSIGIDLSEKYCRIAAERVMAVAGPSRSMMLKGERVKRGLF